MPKDRPQRRLAAILAADVVGYSRMMERDEAGTLARLKAVRRRFVVPAVRAHGGRVVKLLGDGILVEFGSVVEAVVAAVDMQRGLLADIAPDPDGRIVLRIGLNVGDLIIDDEDIYGDGVNVAARLEGLAPPGGICISGAVHDQIRDKLPYRFHERGPQQLKNMAREVTVYELRAEDILAHPPVEIAPTRHLKRRGRLASVLAWVLAAALAGSAGLAGWWGLSQPREVATSDPHSAAPARIERPPLSIVVLPFADLSEDKSQGYFADGLTEDLTTDLSRIAGSLVIARNTAFTFKGRAVDVRQLGRELGIRYVLEGSIRRDGDSLRVNAQLVDAETGAHLWAERFDDDVRNALQLQDRVTSRIARSLDFELVEAESRRSQAEDARNVDAQDLALRGWAILNRPRSRDTALQAADLFQQALAMDPDNIRAGLGLARASYFIVTQRLVSQPALLLLRAETLARAAVARDPNNGLAHNVLSDVLVGKKELDEALSEMRRAVELNRNDAGAWGSVGYQLVLLGRFEEALEPLQHAIQISPRDPSLWVWRMWIGLRAVGLGDGEEGLRWVRSAAQTNQQVYPLWTNYAGVAGLYAPEDEARAAVAVVRRLRPEASLEKVAAETPSDNPRYLALRARLIEGLRKAGLPEK